MNKSVRTALALCALIFVSPAGFAQASADNKAEEQRYVSVRIHVYSKNYKTVAEDGSGLKFKLRVSAALYEYETLDELFDQDIEHINALGLRPKLEF